jgi:hypothetical protein
MIKTILILLAVATFSFGQIEQGTYQLGGGLGFQTGSNKSGSSEIDQTSWNISPQASYFLIDNFSIGLALSYLSSSSTFHDDDETDQDFLLFGPAVKYYFALNETTYPFVKASYSHSISDWASDNSRYKSDNSTKADRYVLGAGISIFLNDYVSIEPMLVYDMSRYARTYTFKDKQFGDVDKDRSGSQSNFLVFSMGISYYIF